MSAQSIKVVIKDTYMDIDRDVFVLLLNYPFINETKGYILTLETNTITISKLKELSKKAGVPYPLLFSTLDHAQIQKNRNDKLVSELIPQVTNELKAASRGSFNIKEIELIIKDIAIRQAFLTRDIHPQSRKNIFIGSISKKVKFKESIEKIADSIRGSLGIELSMIRTKTKNESLAYLVSCIENNAMYVSFSTHNYMPQNIDKQARFSGICIKNNFFPFIFINTRDGDEDPIIYESAGRQIYTLLVLVVCIALNRFQEINIDDGTKDDLSKLIYDIASEIIIPERDTQNHTIKNIDDLELTAKHFGVTPSMCLFRFHSLNLINTNLKDELRAILILKRPKSGGRSKKGETHKKYLKYNGKKYSIDIFNAEKNKKIPRSKVMSALFKKNRYVDSNFVNKYKSEL